MKLNLESESCFDICFLQLVNEKKNLRMGIRHPQENKRKLQNAAIQSHYKSINAISRTVDAITHIDCRKATAF